MTTIVLNTDGGLLLVHKTGNNLWALPGGGVDPGESVSEAVVREVKEETGLDVEVTDLVGVNTNPRHVMAYDDSEVRQQFSLCFRTRLLGGKIATSSETSEVEFVDPASTAVAPPPTSADTWRSWRAAPVRRIRSWALGEKGATEQLGL